MNDWKELQELWDVQDMYRFLVQRYILEKTKLERIDTRMKKYEIPFIPYPPDKKDKYMNGDFMNLQYIYMRNDIHMERLTEEQIATIEEARESLTEEKLVKAMTLVQDTYKEVLAFVETPDIEVELFPSVSGEGNVPGNAIVFLFAVVPDYDEQGNIRNWEKENRKRNVLYALKTQLEPICEEILRMPVRFVVDYPFDEV